jgi:hypothetical protein
VSAATRARRAALRALTFTSASVTIELEIGEDVLLGQLVPPRPGAVEVQVVTGDVVTAEVDEVGGFAVRPLPPASFRLRCRTADGGDVLTGWIDP